MTTLFIGIPLDDVDDLEEVTNKANAIVTKHGGSENGAGFGFGFRDIDWDFDGVVPSQCIEELQEAFPGCRIHTNITLQ